MAAQKIYLLDANVLITAHRDYYPMDMVPEFWTWLLHKAQQGIVKMPLETFEEVRDGGGKAKKDPLVDWLGEKAVKDALLLNEEVDPDLVVAVLKAGYGDNLNDTEIEQIGRDPFLVAYGFKDPVARIIVSVEVSAPSKKRANRRVPDVCKDNGISCCNTFAMLKALGFSTKWQA